MPFPQSAIPSTELQDHDQRINRMDHINSKRLPIGQDFFLDPDVVGIARALIGKYCFFI